MPRYVILEHDWNGIHLDLMLEQGEVLATWRLASLLSDGIQMVDRLPDHRVAYLTYEGDVSGNRGTVRRVAEGRYVAALTNDQCWMLEMQGTFVGKLNLRHVAGDSWHLEWRPHGEAVH